MLQQNSFTKLALALTLTAGLSLPGFSDDHSLGAKTSPSSAPARTTANDAFSLLPASDAIAVIDVARIMNDLIPQLRALSPETAGKFEKEVADFISQTGIDPLKIKSAVIGVNMSGKNTIGAAIVEGVTFDPLRITTTLKDKKEEVKVIDYKGKSVYVVASKAPAKAGEKVGIEVEQEMAFTQLNPDRVALGTLTAVKSVVDGGSGNANTALGAILDQTGTGLIRFAANLPASATASLAGQGDLFKQFSTIKTVFGSFDLASDLSATLDTKMRTATTEEASQLQTSLAGLVGVGKMFLGGNNDPELKIVSDLLDLIRIGAQGTDVSLSLTVPRKMFDAFAEMSKKKKTEKTDK